MYFLNAIYVENTVINIPNVIIPAITTRKIEMSVISRNKGFVLSSKTIRPKTIDPAISPEIIPCPIALNRKGRLMNLGVAPTNCIVLIRNLLEKRANRMVLLIIPIAMNSSITAISKIK